MENTNNQSAGARPDHSKLIAVLCYVGFFWVLGLTIEPEKNNPYVRNHANNGIIISICYVVFGLVNIVPFLGQLVSVVGCLILFVFTIIGIVKACQNSTWTVPVIGEKLEFLR
ncbi:MAG: hypothetical protein J6127_03170 [Clostridiales bacterium]|nr:hypothetical protein [Clostridiales bacterium]